MARMLTSQWNYRKQASLNMQNCFPFCTKNVACTFFIPSPTSLVASKPLYNWRIWIPFPKSIVLLFPSSKNTITPPYNSPAFLMVFAPIPQRASFVWEHSVEETFVCNSIHVFKWLMNPIFPNPWHPTFVLYKSPFPKTTPFFLSSHFPFCRKKCNPFGRIS